MFKAILFDLDGTLLPLDQDFFLKTYFGRITHAAANEQVDAKAIMQGMWVGIDAMQKNNGPKSNGEVFEEAFLGCLGEAARPCLAAFDRFYEASFDDLRFVCEDLPAIPALVGRLKAEGYRLVLATSPMFPRLAVMKRLAWAHLDPADFELITTCENCVHAKPDARYYADILDFLGLPAGECIMVGNDVDEDMAAQALGLQVFLLTDHMVNRGGKDISAYPHGDVTALTAFLLTQKGV